ncbi:hypothetical protein B0H67DRAFT_555871 [Lasiosphaeris hirsuta]|uniref:Uncharacterized protein n=1 Tax=Lasiosphaeris hirsuta TaxID=260670 RepID=A0AA40AA13_9PEZI|nr:hypothetical protein B0H67DRAFT_555871 [Lasiosphaeris hirsuta]
MDTPTMDTLQRIKEAQTPKRTFRNSPFSLAIQKLRGELDPAVSIGSWTCVSRSLALQGLGEARRYLADPILSYRLGYATQAVLDSAEPCARKLTGGVLYARRLHASMTLFDYVINTTALEKSARAKEACRRVLDKYFEGESDVETVAYIERQEALEVAADDGGDSPEESALLRIAMNMFLLGLDAAVDRDLETEDYDEEELESVAAVSDTNN